MRYYSMRGSVLPGGYPEREWAEKIVNFDTRIFCKEIDSLAWGYVEYKKELTPGQADAYGLVLEGKRQYWCVTTVYDNYGRITAKVIKAVEAFSKPLNMSKRIKEKKICREWFESQEEAEGLSQQDIDRIYDAQRRVYWEADFVNRYIDRREAGIGLCNLSYESLADEREILDKAYSLYEKAEDGNVAYLDTLDVVIDQVERWHGTNSKEYGQEGNSGSCPIWLRGKGKGLLWIR